MKHYVTLGIASAGACVFATVSALSAVFLDISPPGTTAGIGLSPLNEFLAGAPGLGGTGSGGEIGSGIAFDPATLTLQLDVGYGSAAGFTDLTGAAFSWFLHGPSPIDQAGPVMIDLAPLHHFATDPLQGGFLEGEVHLTQTQADEVLAGLTYINLYTPDFPGGELRGQLIVAQVPEPVTTAWLWTLVAVGGAVFRSRASRPS